MTLTPDLALVEKALDNLERQEVRVLVWGLVDSALSEEEVDERLADVEASQPAPVESGPSAFAAALARPVNG